MFKKVAFLLFFLLIFAFSQADEEPYYSSIYFYHLDIPDHRVVKVPERVLKFEEKKIKVIFKKGEPNTYRLAIQHNEINENIFILEHYVSAQYMSLADAGRSYYLYNTEAFLVYYNQNGFFPISNNEYYLINETKSKIYKLIPDDQIHPLTEGDKTILDEKIIPPLCRNKHLLYVLPHDLCEK